MMVFQADLLESKSKTRPSQSQEDKDNKNLDSASTRQRNMKSERSIRLNSLMSDTSLSEIDMEESGYLESYSIPENETFSASPRSDFSHASGFSNGLEHKHETKSHNGVSNNSRISHAFKNEAATYGSELTVGIAGKTNLSLTNSICSDESLEGDLTNEHTRLTTVMNNIDPKRLHNYLKRKLKHNDISTILALSSLLPKKKFKAETLHCVRCHKEFDPKHGDKTCRLFHRENDVMKISEDLTGSDFGCEHCGTVFRVEGKWKYKQSYNKKHDCGSCFVGKHTVCTDEVFFEPEGITKTCEDHGCIVFYV